MLLWDAILFRCVCVCDAEKPVYVCVIVRNWPEATKTTTKGRTLLDAMNIS